MSVIAEGSGLSLIRYRLAFVARGVIVQEPLHSVVIDVFCVLCVSVSVRMIGRQHHSAIR